MFTSRGFKATLFFLTIVLMLGFQSHHLSNAEDDDDSDDDGASCSAVATGWDNTGQGAWIAWAGFSARYSAEGKNVGDSVDGSYDLYAYMPGGNNGWGKRDKSDFTLRITRWFIWFGPLKDGTTMGNISQVGYGSSSTHSGSSTAKSECGGAATKKCTWP